MDWSHQRVVVTGGASFIGSHLVEDLVARGATVRVVDSFVSGRQENLRSVAGDIAVLEEDLLDASVAQKALAGVDVVFHLAARHGGRGYVDREQAACASNLALDGAVFLAAVGGAVGKIVYPSSGCVYPLYLQRDPEKVVPLAEAMEGPPYEADNLYGWAKLMGEWTLRAYRARFYGLRVAVLRYFTVYGERGYASHAVTAMIARARARQDPFVVWGDGTAVRNWTHVSDVVRGTVLAAERVDDATPINLGTTEATRVIDAVRLILGHVGFDPAIEFRPDMPVGPLARVADNARARDLLGWTPAVAFADGVRRTADWYFATHTPEEARADVEAYG